MYLYNHFKNKNTFTDFYFIFIYFITACLKKYLISSKFFSNRQTYALHFSLTHSPNYKLSVCVCVCVFFASCCSRLQYLFQDWFNVSTPKSSSGQKRCQMSCWNSLLCSKSFTIEKKQDQHILQDANDCLWQLILIFRSSLSAFVFEHTKSVM